MKRVKVILIQKDTPFIEWDIGLHNEIETTIGKAHNLTIFDYNKPVADQFSGQEVVINLGKNLSDEIFDNAARHASLWLVPSVGLDDIDLDAMHRRGFKVAHTPGIFSGSSLAECALLMILLIIRRFKESQVALANQKMLDPVGDDLGGMTLGIIGFGASGRELARRAKACDMRLMAIDLMSVDQDTLDQYGIDFFGPPEKIDSVISQADIVSLHVPLLPETRKLINGPRLRLMKQSAILVNVARGGLVDELALIEALKNKDILGAGLDVFDTEPPDLNSPLFQLPNVITTPHIAGVTVATIKRRIAALKENIDRFAEGLEPLYQG